MIIWYLYPSLEGVLFYWIFIHLLILSIIDREWLEIPLSIMISMSLGLIIYYVINSHDYMFALSGILTGLGCILFIYGITWLIYRKHALGFGDFQLIAILGAWVGQINIFFVLFLSSFLALIAFVIISLLQGYDRSRKLPFVPYLSLASIIIYLINTVD